MGLTSFLFGCGQNHNSSNQGTTNRIDPEITIPVENISATKDQIDRRLKSEKACKEKNIPVYQNPNSLFVEPEEEVILRTKDEVVDRAIALCYLELKSESADKKMLADFDKKYKVMEKLTPEEKEFAQTEYPTKQQMVDANWRAESFYVMLWALGYINILKYPDEICDVGKDVNHLFSRTEKEFRDNANLRSKTEILDQADLILRLDWACVNARIKGEPSPGELNSSIVYERHYSLNWLIQYMDQDWDHVSTDT